MAVLPTARQNSRVDPGAVIAVAGEGRAGLPDGVGAEDGVPPALAGEEIRLDLERAPHRPEEREGGEDHPEDDEDGDEQVERQRPPLRDGIGHRHTTLWLNSRQVRISTGISRITTPMMVSTEVAPAEPNSCAVAAEVVEDQPAQRGGIGLGRKADDRLEHPEIVHQLHQRHEGRERREMREDDEADALPARGAVDHRDFSVSPGTVCSPA